ncbi:NAD(P)-dependent oxidoreductase [Halocatena marina]|nr:NAD(P)-binding domain-containing protein [Halocatena marina]
MTPVHWRIVCKEHNADRECYSGGISQQTHGFIQFAAANSSMRRIGLIGVGFIGKLFVDDLRSAEYPVTAYDIDESQLEYALERGAEAADSPAAVAAGADVVVLALPGHSEVQSVMEGEPRGVVETLDSDQCVIDTSTTGPEAATEYEQKCTERGAGFVTAPLTRNAPNGDGIHMMVGGSPSDYDEVRPVLDTISEAHTRIGDAHDAQTFKLMIQMRYAGQQAVDAEIVEFGRNNGIDPERMNEFLGMDVWEQYFTLNFSPAIEGLGGLAIWHKDLGYALALARESNTATPLTSTVHEAYKSAIEMADEDEGHAAATIRHWRRHNGAK